MNKNPRQEMDFTSDSSDQCRGVSNRKCWSLLSCTTITKDILNFRQDSVVTCPLGYPYRAIT